MQENRITSVTASSSSETSPTGNEKGNDITSNTNTSTSNANDIDQAQFEADKRAVYKHPLFSLLALLLEKCEQATQGYIPSNSSNSSSTSSPNASTNNNENDSFSRDIQAFVQLIEKEKRPLLTNNAELDGLMIKALQVLRIHLLELEKVQELCRDFCTRYIACLRGKMQSENLLRSDYAMEHISNSNMSNSNSPVNSPGDQEALSNQPTFFGNSNSNNDFLSNTTDDYSNNNSSNHGGFINSRTSLATHLNSTNGMDGSLNMSNTEINIPILAVGGGANTTITSGGIPATHPHQILGSTPLSQIGCPPLNLDHYSAQLSPSCGGDSDDEIDSELESNADDIGSNYSLNSGSKRQKRGILPKHATSVMRAWLFQHLVHPYPTEDEKRAIAAQTNLTLLQVNNWFINARRRILTPMLEHASDSSSNKKSPEQQQSDQITIAKRFWTEQLANSQNSNQLPIEANIENISANINRMDSERLLAIVTQHKLQQQFYSSDESNDEGLLINQQH
ncbi:CLUMA_CG016394, isoform A [Clunio marinus]|uniref:CLUMA_CG016394, isoform A n=1 Tax=Clunio marinus TaxID=568069 RepID=A0A1J1ISS7_9DIPT|nr:CLUMA_CG016394, isoform A [Clunio marinus]